jgi:hypothetical protein
MAVCQFSVSFSGDAQSIFEKTKTAVESQGGTFEGNAESGNFHLSVMSNTISGSYTTSGQELNFTIDTKPIFLPCSAIQGYLASKLG